MTAGDQRGRPRAIERGGGVSSTSLFPPRHAGHDPACNRKGRAATMANTLKLDDFLPYRLSIASNRVSGAIATAYQALFGLRIPEWRLVAVLAEGGEMTQRAIGHVTQMDKVT